MEQIKIYDLFVDLKSANVLPDSGVNPLGLKYNAPDPKWIVKVGLDKKFHGLKNRNESTLIPKSFSTSISDYDAVDVCVFNADPTANKFLACQNIAHGIGDFSKDYNDHNIGKKIEAAGFSIKKLERKPAFSGFDVTENYVHKNIKGILLNFSYSLPLHYKRRNIRIELVDQQKAALEGLIPLKENRSQEINRIIGDYSYFIPYYNLQKVAQIHVMLKGNDKIIQEHFSTALNVEKTIDAVNLKQTVGHLRDGISGILYQLDFKLPELPQGTQLKLTFPSLAAETIKKLRYWNSNQPSKVYSGDQQELPNLKEQQIFVFLPYFVAPKHIHIVPQLTIEAIDVPPIVLAKFKSNEYGRPTSLNDIQIQATSNEVHQFTGLEGQLFSFNTTIPDYYHSKGFFDIQILENGQVMKSGFFINKDAEASNQPPIHNQQLLEVFIPYRSMQADATYEVRLQAKGAGFLLSEPRSERFVNKNKTIKTVGLYLQQVNSKDWKEITYKIGFRNQNNINRTYLHLGYTIIKEESIQGNFKPNPPVAFDFSAAPNDELLIWIKEKNMRDDDAIQIKTSINELINNGNNLTIKNQGAIKNMIFKIIER